MQRNERPRARDIGLTPGRMQAGRFNSITDVSGVLVGQETLVSGDDVRTGVTAVLPHGGNLFLEKVPAAIFVANGYGKLVGSTQVNELGEIETPVMLTNTLCVPRVADALIDYMLELPGNEAVASINPIVAETNDGFLNNIRKKSVGRVEVFGALHKALSGPVEEGCVGAGTGTRALGFKGGIGTSSRVVSRDLGGYTVGAIVQSNFGGSLTINGAPVGREIQSNRGSEDQKAGSVIVVIATDAPLSYNNLRRLSARGPLGLARAGFVSENRSGDYFIAFSTAKESRIENTANASRPRILGELRNDEMDPLFLGAVEATEEAVYNSLFRATTTKGRDNHVVEALPIDETVRILQAHHAI